jgi:hypothetical protein
MSFPIDGTIPASNNPPAQYQPGMQTNFANIKGYLNVDHVLAGYTNAGFHKQVTLNATISTPSVTAPVSVIYSKTVSGSNQLFFNNGTTDYPLSGGNSSLGTSGYTTLPGGVILSWNAGVFNSGSGQSITMPGLSTIYQVTTAINESDPAQQPRIYISGISGAVISVLTGSIGAAARFIAIGV